MRDIDDIKRLRKRLGLTQFALAKRADVSQSLIAKIESKKIDPTYSRVRKIFQTLEDLEKKEQLTAEQVMSRRILSVVPGAAIKEVIQLMRKHQISQIPVIEGHNPVGLVSESVLLDAVMEGKGKTVKDIMAEAPPVVSRRTTVSAVSPLLTHYAMVLVSQQGKLVGVITKSDLLGKAYKG